MSDIRNLLLQVHAITRQYEKLGALTGENFNIFQVLRLGANEVRLHSAFLAELLNPEGTHGLGDTFLVLLVKHLDIRGFEVTKCNVIREEYQGKTDYEQISGGRVDIIIRNSINQAIIIENKIYAGDQKYQLSRYSNLSKKFRNAWLYYLNPNGLDAGEESTNNELQPSKDYFSISYRTHILHWLQDCKKEAADLPHLRETIGQYMNLIKFLTDQTMSNQMKNEVIATITKDKAFIESAFLINQSMDELRHHLFSPFINNISKLLAEYYPIIDTNLGLKKTGITIKAPNWKNSVIRFEFGGNYAGFFYGVLCNDNTTKGFNEALRMKISENGRQQGTAWPWWTFIWEGPMKPSTFFQIETPQSHFYSDFKMKLDNLYKVVEEVENSF